MGRASAIQPEERLRVVHISDGFAPDLAAAVQTGLSAERKSIPSRFFYDETGSELFEQITELPEYYLTRCEQSILEQDADSIVEFAKPPISIVEFGSGSSKKTRLLIEAALKNQSPLTYVSIDIAVDYLKRAAQNLLDDYAGLKVVAVAAEYFDAVDLIPETDCPRLYLFLGSNIGNLEDDEACAFLSKLQGSMNPTDRLLIGMDLAKDPSIIEPAYNDLEGVTATFNKNVLARINRSLGANFDLSGFDHRAPYLADKGRVEMLLESNRQQDVTIRAIGETFHFLEGETIHTENSRKYTLAEAHSIAKASGFAIESRWSDAKGWFALFLLKPVF